MLTRFTNLFCKRYLINFTVFYLLFLINLWILFNYRKHCSQNVVDYSNKLKESIENLNRHVSSDSIADKPGNGASWLCWKNCVDESVNDSGNGSSSDKINCKRRLWSRENIEKRNWNEHQNILQVIAVSATDSLNIGIIKLCLSVLQ